MKRAAFATDPALSRGRLHAETLDPARTPFERDRDRIVHATAFRRLKDKTQVFLFDEGDHYRTRLTHTLEVAQIARAIARSLGLDEDLAEALALAHDLGHPPFGHAGERALAATMIGHGGFDHNGQSLRVVTLLERRYPAFDGLNLTWETLEGLVKHNGPLVGADGQAMPRYGDSLPFAIATYAQQQDLWLATYPSAEAQAAAIADDIAYDAHDIDDGLRAGLLSPDGLADLPLVGGIVADIRRAYPNLGPERTRAEIVRRVIRAMIEDVVAESRRLLETARPESADDVRMAGRPLIAFSESMSTADGAIKQRLTGAVYRNRDVTQVMGRAETIVRRLFAHYVENPSAFPDGWRPSAGEDAFRVATDFLAGMTDRYAIGAYGRFFNETPDLRHGAVV